MALPGPGAPAAAAEPIVGLGILGDSASDEFRADDNRGGEYAAVTRGWVELLVDKRGLNVGPWGERSEPRRSGYEYNWARSGARVADLIGQGQHLGLAEQVRAGQVSHVIIRIGANDFASWNGTYAEIYDGSLDDAAVRAKVETMVGGVATAVDAVRAAGPARVILTTLADNGLTSPFQERYPDAARRERVRAAIIAYNDGLWRLAADRGLAVADEFGLASQLLARLDSEGNLRIGGEPISVLRTGDEPHHLLLADGDHLGTVGNGLIVNLSYAPVLKASFDADLAPFSDEELLANAGIAPASSGGPPA